MKVRYLKGDNLTAAVYGSREQMGAAAAHDCAEEMRRLLGIKSVINMVFAAAPSQNEMLQSLREMQGIDWQRVQAFHMDEYIGLPSGAPQRFGKFLENAIFSKLPFKNIFYIPAEKSAEEAISEYSSLLTQNLPDIVCLGIGENGHIAFNDPHVADFNDSSLVKVVDLDEKCRQQQVNDGCFASIEQVPRFAVTLTVPAIMAAGCLVCTVPAASKAEAVKNTLYGTIGEHCPATAMRTHKNARMYLDKDSASLV